MSYYALKDTDWPWDDECEGRAVVVRAGTPEEAIKIATAMHLAEHPGAGGVTWDVARLNLVAFGGAVWESDNQPVFEELTYYTAGINGPPDKPPVAASIPPYIEHKQGGEVEPMDVEGMNYNCPCIHPSQCDGSCAPSSTPERSEP